MSRSSVPYASPFDPLDPTSAHRAAPSNISDRQARQAMLHSQAQPPIAEAMPPARLFFSFKGRISRRSFWGGMCGLAALGIVLGAFLNIAGYHGERVEGGVNLLMAWPALAISAKRWHDRNHSGWWALVALIPVVGTLWLLIANGLLPSQPGDNRFGPQPRHLKLG